MSVSVDDVLEHLAEVEHLERAEASRALKDSATPTTADIWAVGDSYGRCALAAELQLWIRRARQRMVQDA